MTDGRTIAHAPRRRVAATTRCGWACAAGIRSTNAVVADAAARGTRGRRRTFSDSAGGDSHGAGGRRVAGPSRMAAVARARRAASTARTTRPARARWRRTSARRTAGRCRSSSARCATSTSPACSRRSASAPRLRLLRRRTRRGPWRPPSSRPSPARWRPSMPVITSRRPADAIAHAASSGSPVVVAGSLYLVGEIRWQIS